ncbi:hypothetical protein CSV75_04345 [Sporosarcina sp. P18a]|uniref:hypothetical protein n=1 Tax=Sporosarcina sp. P18a TaxID=2048259 RepID=UPI000C166904|nr:hypothetical protein [Sporosarcina sp. P18a]PIC81015.1 hypothetical protein CSV75_04345 [Sporosarcina sp. P18a]
MTIALQRRVRRADGTFGDYEKVFKGMTPEEKVKALEDMNKALMLTVTDMYEGNMDLQEMNRNVMLVITDLYEKVYSEEGVTE